MKVHPPFILTGRRGWTLFAGTLAQAELMRERRSHGEKLKFAWDSQGFRKLVVVLTRAGKVLGLHNGDGRAVWTQMIGASERAWPGTRAVLEVSDAEVVGSRALVVM